MESNHAMQVLAQNIPPWLGLFIGHVAQGATLQNIALLMSIAYSTVNIWIHIRKKK